MFDQLVISFTIGAAGFLISGPLTQPGEVLAWWPKFVAFILRTADKNPYDWNLFQYWFSKITYVCAKCIAGNLALMVVILESSWFTFSCGRAAQVVVLSIFFAYIIDRWMQN